MLARLSQALGKPIQALRLHALYARTDYLAAYARHTDRRVAKDPAEAVSGMWEEIGSLQFEFLVKQGLQPWHRLLDIGCGTLRGGHRFIRYLDAEQYTGTDISAGALEAGCRIVEQQGLTDKRPRLVLTEDLKFRDLDKNPFDFVLAQSVFTHLPVEYIDECFQHLRRVMRDKANFYFTFDESQQPQQLRFKSFTYPFSFFAELAARYHFDIHDLSIEYPHPRGQRMAAISPRQLPATEGQRRSSQ